MFLTLLQSEVAFEFQIPRAARRLSAFAYPRLSYFSLSGRKSRFSCTDCAICHWLLAIGYWLLAIGYWLLAIGYHALGSSHVSAGPRIYPDQFALFYK